MADHMIVSCPHCGAKHNRRSQVTRAGEPRSDPSDGSITLCISCGEWSIFTETLDMRKPTEEELALIAVHPTAMKLREAWAAIRAGRVT